MTEISFYQLTSINLFKALPSLLEKILEKGYKVLVKCNNEELMNQLDLSIWTYSSRRFVPHAKFDDPDPELQPILLVHDIKYNLNKANILVITGDEVVTDNNQFERIIDIFDGNDQNSLEAARKRYKSYLNMKYSLTYFKQNDDGSWEKKQS